MIRFFIIFLLCISMLSAAERPRLAVLTDIGGDPDDQQSLVRLLVYSNEFEIEALIASSAGTLGELKEPTTRADLIKQTVEAYGKVRPNLVKHAQHWPETEQLLKVIRSGSVARGRDAIGAGKETEASRLLIVRIDAGSAERPLHISVWGGQTDLAQALWSVKSSRDAEAWKTFTQKFRVYDINDQDKIADWMRGEFPNLNYILAMAPPNADKRTGIYRGIYLTGDEALTSQKWIQDNVVSTGPLGAHYPTKTWTAPNKESCMKEGDTPAWFFFLPQGGNDPADPTKPGWGGRFVRADNGWFRDVPAKKDFDPRTEVSRWRPAFQADFAKRMAWSRE